jgi:hypothetical protein
VVESVVVQHPFYAAGRLMHAGKYNVTCDHQAGEIVLADDFGCTMHLPAVGVRINDVCDITQLDFVRDGERLLLHQIHLRDEGHIDIADVLQLAEVINIDDYRRKS